MVSVNAENEWVSTADHTTMLGRLGRAAPNRIPSRAADPKKVVLDRKKSVESWAKPLSSAIAHRPYGPLFSSTMQNTKIIGRRIPTTKPTRNPSVTTGPQPTKQPPSVPIAIFRELSADLQATHANIESLQAENLELAAQNQQLRHDLEQLAAQTQEVVQRFRHMAIGAATDDGLMLDELGFDAESATTRSQVLEQLYRALPGYAPDAAVAPRSGGEHRPKAARPRQFSTQAPPPFYATATASDAELSGWKLTLVMGLIVFSAFGAGFLVVRPLLAPAPQR
jgi:hypothetical protein